MERFGLTRHDLMLMAWTEVMMLFDSVYEDETPRQREDVRAATQEDIMNWI